MSQSNPPERTPPLNDDLVRQTDLDDPTYVNRSGRGVEDDGPSKYGKGRRS